MPAAIAGPDPSTLTRRQRVDQTIASVRRPALGAHPRMGDRAATPRRRGRATRAVRWGEPLRVIFAEARCSFDMRAATPAVAAEPMSPGGAIAELGGRFWLDHPWRARLGRETPFAERAQIAAPPLSPESEGRDGSLDCFEA
jgi:hypothetical protein